MIVTVLFYLEKQEIRVITKLPNSEQSYKGKVKTHKYINRQNQSISVLKLKTKHITQSEQLKQISLTDRRNRGKIDKYH